MRGEYSWTVDEAQDAMYTAAGVWDRGYQRVIVRAASSAGAKGARRPLWPGNFYLLYIETA